MLGHITGRADRRRSAGAMPASRRQVASGLAGDMRSVAEGPKGRATGAFPRVTKSARPDMREGSEATVAHIG